MKFIATTFLLTCSLFIVIALEAIPVSAQTITETKIYTPDFIFYVQHNPNATTTFTCQNPTVLESILQSGDTAAIWDMTTAKWTLDPPHTETDSFMLATGLPLATDSDFVKSDIVIRTTVSPTTMRYHFFAIDPSSNAFDLGITEVTNGVARKVIGWNPPIQDAAYPMVFGTTWQSTAVEDGDTLPPGSHRTIASKSVVNGWGNLILIVPSGHAEGALRVKEQHIENVSGDGITNSIDTTIIYHYYTEGFYSASIVTDTKGNILSATYTEDFDAAASVAEATRPNQLGLTISQNPASTSVTKVFFTLKNDANARVELVDMMGRSVRVLQNGRASQGAHVLAIDPNTLASGSYFVRATAEGKSVMQKLVIAR
jgi:hypothetical protein